jgi:hypothetical protein
VVKGVQRADGSRVWLSVSTTRVDLPAPHRRLRRGGSFVDVTARSRRATRWSRASTASAT